MKPFSQDFLGILHQAQRLISNPKIPKFLEREVTNARQLWNDTNNLALDHMDKLKRNKILLIFFLFSNTFLDNQSSWEKFHDQKTNLTMAIDLGEKEKNDIQRVFNFLLFHFC